MPRNFVRRIEVMFPIEDEALRDRLHDEILATMCADGAKAWRLRADGCYVRDAAADQDDGPPPLRSQQRFIERARERAHAPAAASAAPGAYRTRAAPAAWSPPTPRAPAAGSSPEPATPPEPPSPSRGAP
jgi:polyphosphate kinase